jgi:hypothetical protein
MFELRAEAWVGPTAIFLPFKTQITEMCEPHTHRLSKVSLRQTTGRSVKVWRFTQEPHAQNIEADLGGPNSLYIK